MFETTNQQHIQTWGAKTKIEAILNSNTKFHGNHDPVLALELSLAAMAVCSSSSFSAERVACPTRTSNAMATATVSRMLPMASWNEHFLEHLRHLRIFWKMKCHYLYTYIKYTQIWIPKWWFTESEVRYFVGGRRFDICLFYIARHIEIELHLTNEHEYSTNKYDVHGSSPFYERLALLFCTSSTGCQHLWGRKNFHRLIFRKIAKHAWEHDWWVLRYLAILIWVVLYLGICRKDTEEDWEHHDFFLDDSWRLLGLIWNNTATWIIFSIVFWKVWLILPHQY